MPSWWQSAAVIRPGAEACAAKHGAKAAYSDLGAMLRDSRVDAVFIASPNALHVQHALQAAQAGKHVFSEKPMTTTLDDAVAMVRTCRARGVKLGVGYHLRQHPGVREARRLVAEGALGTVALAQGQWGFGVRGQDRPPPRTGLRQWWDDPDLMGHASTMMGTGVHVVDTLRFVLGQEITEVAATPMARQQCSLWNNYSPWSYDSMAAPSRPSVAGGVCLIHATTSSSLEALAVSSAATLCGRDGRARSKW